MQGVELDKSAIFARIGYRPHAGQARVHASRARRRVVCAGVRWGKSEAAAAEAVCALVEPREKATIWTVAPTLDLTDRVLTRVLVWVETAFKHRILSYEKRERTLTVRNLGGGVTVLRAKTADSPASLLGESLDFLIVDECVRIPANVWHRHLAARLVDRRGGAFLISTAAPKTWFYDEWRRGQRGRDKEYESWSAPSSENPFLDPAAIEAERARLPVDVFHAEFLGEFIGTENEPCDTCHGPVPGGRGLVIIDRDAGEYLRHCPQCGLAVDPDGRSLVALWPNGNRFLMVIEGVTLAHRPEHPPELPGSSPQ